MTTNFQKIQQFQSRFDADVSLYKDLLAQRLAFIQEEVRETAEAVAEVKSATPQTLAPARAHLVKELVDILYITYGTLELMGVDADAAFEEVHRSNMTKSENPQGGKLLKGPSFQPAQMEQFIHD